MKSFIFLFTILSFAAAAQSTNKPDTLKLPAAVAKMIDGLNKEKKELQPTLVRAQSIDKEIEGLIKSSLDWNKIPYENFKDLQHGIILYTKPEEKKK